MHQPAMPHRITWHACCAEVVKWVETYAWHILKTLSCAPCVCNSSSHTITIQQTLPWYPHSIVTAHFICPWVLSSQWFTHFPLSIPISATMRISNSSTPQTGVNLWRIQQMQPDPDLKNLNNCISFLLKHLNSHCGLSTILFTLAKA